MKLPGSTRQGWPCPVSRECPASRAISCSTSRRANSRDPRNGAGKPHPRALYEREQRKRHRLAERNLANSHNRQKPRSLADEWCDTTTPHGRLMLTVLGGLAEFERELPAGPHCGWAQASSGAGRKAWPQAEAHATLAERSISAQRSRGSVDLYCSPVLRHSAGLIQLGSYGRVVRWERPFQRFGGATLWIRYPLGPGDRSQAERLESAAKSIDLCQPKRSRRSGQRPVASSHMRCCQRR